MTAPFLTALAVTAGGAVVMAAAGAVLTDIGPWYHALRKPSWKPPDWAFGPVWTAILALLAYAAALAWTAASAEGRWLLAVLLLLNAALHIAWSGIFFKLRRPDWALIEVVALWLSIAALIAGFLPHSPFAAWLLVPYLVWVAVAAFLNYRIVKLNGPFSGRPPGA